jgi:hypothetical protein
MRFCRFPYIIGPDQHCEVNLFSETVQLTTNGSHDICCMISAQRNGVLLLHNLTGESLVEPTSTFTGHQSD